MKVESKKVEVVEGDLTPMIDMTFQLIAFFMVLVNFGQTESHDLVVLPSSVLVKPRTNLSNTRSSCTWVPRGRWPWGVKS